MAHIQNNAESAVRQLLKQISKRALKDRGESRLHAIDYMDDGSPIELSVHIDGETVEPKRNRYFLLRHI
jgi:5-oxoprolinase (ATP-hydrolysing)